MPSEKQYLKLNNHFLDHKTAPELDLVSESLLFVVVELSHVWQALSADTNTHNHMLNKRTSGRRLI